MTLKSRRTLTDLAVKNAEPRAARYELPDGKAAGLYLVVQPSGVKSWAFRYRFGGQSKKLTLGRYPALTLGGARAAVKAHAVTIAKGADPAVQKQEHRKKLERPRVFDLCERYIEEWTKVRNKPKTFVENERYCRQYIIPELGKKFVAEVTFDDIEAFLARVLHRQTAAQRARTNSADGDSAPAATNRLRSVVQKVFALAETKFGMRPLNSNPVKGTGRQKDVRRHRLAEVDELPRLAEALDHFAEAYPRKVAALWVLFLTGGRVNEINGARVSEWRGDRIVKPTHKTDARIGEKSILIPAPARAILTAVTPDESGLLFGPGALRPAWEKVRERAGCPDLQLRDARRTFASAAKSAGKSLDQIGEMLHHCSVQTTRGYSWLFEDSHRTAVEETGAQLAGMMCGRTARPDAA